MNLISIVHMMGLRDQFVFGECIHRNHSFVRIIHVDHHDRVISEDEVQQ